MLRAGPRDQAEVAADAGDDFADRARADVNVKLGGVEVAVQLRLEFGLVAVAAGTPDGVLDLADDAPAGGGALLDRDADGCAGFGDGPREGDAVADGAGGVVEGRGKAEEGVERETGAVCCGVLGRASRSCTAGRGPASLTAC